MLETHTPRKNKVCLSDYNYRKDIDNRLLMAQFSSLDLAILEEVLFSSLLISPLKIARNLGKTEENVLFTIKKLVKAGLLKEAGSDFIVDKEMRKYFESQAMKFEPDFKPDMEYLQTLLKKVPIHILPCWYSISRTSNNIFNSIIEKYLATPLIFQRYLMDINFSDPTFSAIAQDVFRAPNFQIPSKDIIEKYELSLDQFEETMLFLEFNFICCIAYEKIGDEFREIVTPFYEWREYLSFLKRTQPKTITDVSKIQRTRPANCSFIQDMTAVLTHLKKGRVSLNTQEYTRLLSVCENLKDLTYLKHLIEKLSVLKFVNISDEVLTILPHADEWLNMRVESQAIALYRHPLNRLCSYEFANEKLLREAEKSIQRVLYSGWVLFDEFIDGVMVPLNERTTISLRKTGKSWRYTIPDYTPDEKRLIKATLFEWLFEIGVTAIGTYEGRDCFCVTPFGQSLFG